MNDRQESQSFRNLPRPQKVAVVSLGIVAIGILVIWFWQFNTRINSPFQPSKEEVAQAEKAQAEKEALTLANQTKDTDSDGLTDVEEVNNYKTSPYLEDTDGDGLSDFSEIKSNKDPLCAEGASCDFVASALNSATTTNLTATSTPAENVDQELLVKALSGEGTAEMMRQILIQGGANQNQINLLSDEDLMSIYSEVLQAQQPGTVISSSTASSTNQ